MKSSRRSFVKNTALAFAATSLLPEFVLAGNKRKELTGIQLYSVRTDMTRDPLDTLKQLSVMGYKHVEHANYVNRKFYGFTVLEFRNVLDGMGLKMPSGHTVMGSQHWDESKKDFTDAWKYTVEDAAAMGQQFVISPSMDSRYKTSYDELKRFMEVFNKCGELCKKSGMKFGYHNHDFEFSQKLNGETMYDIILKSTDPDLVMQQLDTGNLYNGGAKAIDIVNQYPGRFMSVHVKDEIKAAAGEEKFESTILGAGIVNLKAVIDAIKKKSKHVHYIIEQEAYQGKTPLECAKENFKIMKEWGYA
ncbi:sugar phosphate isomerase/epimerase family protein [Ferruginibacter sp.]|nr:sugar phosphate isomerase/epimerase [Ferruginibacter sp.]